MNTIQELQQVLTDHQNNIVAIDDLLADLATEHVELKRYEQTLMDMATTANTPIIEMHYRWVQNRIQQLDLQAAGCKVQRDWHDEGKRRVNGKIIRLEREIKAEITKTMVKVGNRKMEKHPRNYVPKETKRVAAEPTKKSNKKDKQGKHGKKGGQKAA